MDVFLTSWVLAALSIAAVVRERERVNAVLQREHRRVNVLAALTLALSQRHELGSVLEQIVRAAEELLPANGGASVTLWDAETETFTESASTVTWQLAGPAPRVRRTGGASRWVVDHGTPAVVPDAARDPFGANPMLAEAGLRAYAGVPMQAGGRIIGVLYVLEREPREYAEDDLTFLSALANRAANAILKVQLYEELSAARDHLEAQVAERTASLQAVAEALRLKNLDHAAAETAARAERDFSDTLIDSLPGVFYLVHPARRFLRWNKNLEQVTGYTGDELRALDAAQIFLAEDLPRVRENFMKVLQAGAAHVEARVQTRAGACVPYAFTGLRVTVGDAACMAGVGLDITERQESEAALRASEEHFAKMFQGSPVAMCLSTLAEGRILDANPAFLALFGCERAEVVGQVSVAVGLWPKPEQRAGFLAELGQRGNIFNRENVFRKKNGETGVALFSAERLHIAGQACVLVLFNDITARKQAEAAVETSRAQLRALLARLQRAREEERTRLAREVHDVLGQLLTGMKMDLAWCERRLGKISDPELGGALGEKHAALNQLADTMIESVQKIARELRPSLLDNLGLVAAIHSEARQFEARSGIACWVVAPSEMFALERHRATNVYRIFRRRSPTWPGTPRRRRCTFA